jgi:hypothetical protein
MSEYWHKPSCEPGCKRVHRIAVDEITPPPLPPLALGISPSGKAVPIRVDEDGYVLMRPAREEPA